MNTPITQLFDTFHQHIDDDDFMALTGWGLSTQGMAWQSLKLIINKIDAVKHALNAQQNNTYADELADAFDTRGKALKALYVKGGRKSKSAPPSEIADDQHLSDDPENQQDHTCEHPEAPIAQPNPNLAATTNAGVDDKVLKLLQDENNYLKSLVDKLLAALGDAKVVALMQNR